MSSLRHTCQLSAATAAALIGMPVAAAVAQQSGDGSGNGALVREKLILSEAAINGLTESLAVANGETELFKRKFDELNTRVEALGIAPAGKDTEVLRSRLVSAVRDMRLLQKENDNSREQLIRLTEAVMDLLKTSEGIDAQSRLKVEQELRAATPLTLTGGNSLTVIAGLTSGAVVDYKPELAMVVANLGARQGVKIGMPFQVWRGETQVASVRVVDVRDSISGAVVQSIASNSHSIKSGDTLRVDTTR